MIDFIENVCQAGCQKALYCKTYARFQVTLWATEIKKISLVSRSWSTVWINMQKMSNGDYFDEKMRRGDRSKEARRISPPLKLLLKSPKLRGSTAPKSAHLHRGREQGERENLIWKKNHPLKFWTGFEPDLVNYAIEIECPELNFHKNEILGNHGSVFKGNHVTPWKTVFLSLKNK